MSQFPQICTDFRLLDITSARQFSAFAKPEISENRTQNLLNDRVSSVFDNLIFDCQVKQHVRFSFAVPSLFRSDVRKITYGRILRQQTRRHN